MVVTKALKGVGATGLSFIEEGLIQLNDIDRNLEVTKSLLEVLKEKHHDKYFFIFELNKEERDVECLKLGFTYFSANEDSIVIECDGYVKEIKEKNISGIDDFAGDGLFLHKLAEGKGVTVEQIFRYVFIEEKKSVFVTGNDEKEKTVTIDIDGEDCEFGLFMSLRDSCIFLEV